VAPRMDGPAFGDDVATMTAAQPDALAPQLDRPVFTDGTGRRAGILRWGAAGFCVMGAVLCAALAVTLQTHVLLPSLVKAFLGSSDGIAPAAGISDTSGAGVAPRTKLRGDSREIVVPGQHVELSEPTFDAAATDQPVATIPATEQRAQRVARTRAAGSGPHPIARTRAAAGSEPHPVARTRAAGSNHHAVAGTRAAAGSNHDAVAGTRAAAGSEPHPVAGTPKRDASAPNTVATDRHAKVGAAQALPGSKAKWSAAAKPQKSSAARTRHHRTAPKISEPSLGHPRLWRSRRPNLWLAEGGRWLPE
jgi:hypothetical protein